MLERFFGATLTITSGRIVPVRLIGEQHVIEDLGFIPSFADWVRCIRPEPWMGRAQPIHATVDPFAIAACPPGVPPGARPGSLPPRGRGLRRPHDRSHARRVGQEGGSPFTYLWAPG